MPALSVRASGRLRSRSVPVPVFVSVSLAPSLSLCPLSPSVCLSHSLSLSASLCLSLLLSHALSRSLSRCFSRFGLISVSLTVHVSASPLSLSPSPVVVFVCPCGATLLCGGFSAVRPTTRTSSSSARSGRGTRRPFARRPSLRSRPRCSQRGGCGLCFWSAVGPRSTDRFDGFCKRTRLFILAAAETWAGSLARGLGPTLIGVRGGSRVSAVQARFSQLPCHESHPSPSVQSSGAASDAGGFGGRLALPRAGVAQVVDRMRPLFARGQAILAGIRSGPKKAKSVAFADEDE